MSDQQSPRLAIIMPSFRFDRIARQALASVAAIGGDDICVHIGDNSENPEKHAFLRDLAARSRNVTVSYHVTNIGAEANWLHLVKAQTAPLICMAADDDSFCEAYFAAGIELMATDKGCGAAHGLLLSVAYEAGRETPTVYSPPERLERDPLDRIKTYNDQNSIAYAITRHRLIRDFADYVERNPIKAAFNDYLLAYHILSTGTYRLDRKGYAYVYNDDAWHGPDAFLKSSAKFYVPCGLPEAFANLMRVHEAVASVHFFSSTFRAPELSDAMAGEIAAYLFDRWLKDFAYFKRRPAAEALLADHPDAARALAEILDRPYASNPDIFGQFTRIVAAFAPELAARYHAFLTETMLPRALPRPKPAPSRLEKLRFWARR